MNAEQQEHRICCIIRETCERFDAKATFTIGEYTEDEEAAHSRMSYGYVRGARDLRNHAIAVGLMVAAGAVFLTTRTYVATATFLWRPC